MKAELRRAAGFVLLCLGWLAAFNLLGYATTVIVPSDEEMLIGARAVVRGQVTAVASGYDEAHQGIFTYITLNVSDVIKGRLSKGEIILKEPGGIIKERGSVVFGTPTFTVGEQVLLYLDTWPDGSLRVYQWFLGKFTITSDRTTGKLLIKRDVPTQRIEIVGRSTSGIITDHAELDAYVTNLRNRLNETQTAARQQETRYYANIPLLTRPAELSAAAPTVTPLFTLINNNTPPRWFEPDTGQNVVFKINPAGAYNSQVVADLEAAFAAWSNVSGVSLRVVNGGTTTGCGLTSLNGENTVSFNNCDNYSAFNPPAGWSCSGILAAAGIVSYSLYQTRVVNGITFYRGLEGNLAFNPYAACYFTSNCNVREVATHELGHALGIGHSFDATATMYAYAHFDGRCASVKVDDENAVRFIYPGSNTTPPSPTALTITTNSLPNGQANVSYTQSFTATGGTTPYSWNLIGGTLPAGLTLNANGTLSGTSTAATTVSFTVKVTDNNGANAQKAFSLTIANAPAPPAAASGTLTANPHPIRVCDGSGQGVTTLNWTTTNASTVEVRIGSPSGSLFARGGASGSVTTGRWVTQGMVFYLQNVTNGLPLIGANTLATYTASLTTSGCTLATGSLTINPTPIRVCDGSGLGVATLNWTTSANVTEIHVGAPNGPLFARGGTSGALSTYKWVTNGMVFYLQNVSNGLPLTSANTFATATATLTTSGCSTTIWATPNPIAVCDGTGLAVATINWNVANVSLIEVRVGVPNGPLFARSGPSGFSITGKWVPNGMVFYLQNASFGNSTSAANTLGTTMVNVTTAGCSNP